MRGSCGLVVALALLLPPSALGQARTALSWVRRPGAEGCIAAPELGRRVESLVGPVLAAASEGEVSIEGWVQRSGGRFEASVVVTDAKGRVLGSRELATSGPDCRSLDDPLVFVIAVAIDPNAALAELPGELSDEADPGGELLEELRSAPPAPRAEGRAGAPPASPPDRTPAPSAEASGATPLNGLLAVGPVVTAGWLAAPAPGVAVEAGLATEHWSHHLRAMAPLPQIEAIDGQREVAVGGWQLDLRSCPTLLWQRPWRLSPCVGVAAARLWAEPRGFAGNDRDAWLLGPLLAVHLSVGLGSVLSLRLGVEGQALWPRHRITYRSAGEGHEIHQMGAAQGSAGIFVVARF